jgi:hypothetical protein
MDQYITDQSGCRESNSIRLSPREPCSHYTTSSYEGSWSNTSSPQALSGSGDSNPVRLAPKEPCLPLHHIPPESLCQSSCVSYPTMTIGTAYFTFCYLFFNGTECCTPLNKSCYGANLHASDMIEVEHDGIGLSTIDTRMCRQIVLDPIP